MSKTNASRVRQVSYTVPVETSDSVDLPDGVTRAIMVGTDGAVAVTYANGMSDTVQLLSGVVHPIEVARVKSTGTTATLIKACY